MATYNTTTDSTRDVEKLKAGQSYDYVHEGLSSEASKTSSDEYDPILATYDARAQSRIVHRIDRRLIPICGIMYCVSLLDRTNLSNANIAG